MMDISKYVLTAVIITSAFEELSDVGWVMYVVGVAGAAILFLFSILVMKFINNEEIESNRMLVTELEGKIKTNLYKPAVIIDYERRAFTYPVNDVRITLDYNISCSYEFPKFFEKNINSIPLLEKNTAILEVKYNDFLPDFIKNIINIKNLEITSFSKYATGRAMLEKIERRI